MPDKSEILVRKASPLEFNLIRHTYILSSWIKFPAYYMPKDYYMEKRKPYIDGLLENEDTSVLVAFSQDNPLVVMGYIIFTGEFIHYVYVKYVYRKFGLATSLIKKAVGDNKTIETDHMPFRASDMHKHFKDHKREIKWSCFNLIYKPYGI